MFERVPNFVEPSDNFTVVWGVEKLGWGEFMFYVGTDKKVHCRNEIMSKEFIKARLCEMVDNCILDEPPTLAYRPEKKE